MMLNLRLFVWYRLSMHMRQYLSFLTIIFLWSDSLSKDFRGKFNVLASRFCSIVCFMKIAVFWKQIMSFPRRIKFYIQTPYSILRTAIYEYNFIFGLRVLVSPIFYISILDTFILYYMLEFLFHFQIIIFFFWHWGTKAT